MDETAIPSQIVRRTLPPCLVCGGKSSGINFGVSTCPPCKAFFRRNAVKLQTHRFVCDRAGDCPVVEASRRSCNCCRLAKCFRVGMEPSLIRSAAERAARNDLVEQNRRIRKQELAKKRVELIRPSTLLHQSSNESVMLSSSDQTLLTNILSAYEQTCIVPFNTRPKRSGIPNNMALHDFINAYSENSIATIQFYNLVPQFKILSIIDRMYLIRANPPFMGMVNECILVPTASKYLPDIMTSIFGKDLTVTWLRSRVSIEPFMFDPCLLKLFMIVLILSIGTNATGDSITTTEHSINTRTVFAAQNMYVELLWRYIVSRTSNQRCAVQYLTNLIACVLRAQHTCYRFSSHVRSQTAEITQMTSHMQSLWQQLDTE